MPLFSVRHLRAATSRLSTAWRAAIGRAPSVAKRLMHRPMP
jgi:hypothetical protein